MRQNEIITIIDSQANILIASLQADVEIFYKYQEDEDYTLVLTTRAYNGKVFTEDEQWPLVDEEKQLTERKVVITPNNYPFYESRNFIKIFENPGQTTGGVPREEFLLLNRKKTLEERIQAATTAVQTKLEKLPSREVGTEVPSEAPRP